MRKSRSLTGRIATMFAIAGIISILIYGYIMYKSECRTQRDLRLEEVKKVNSYMESLITADSSDFYEFAKLIPGYADKMHISVNVDNYEDSLYEFNRLFSERYPGKTFNVDISLKDMDEDLVIKYLEYDLIYWLTTFENAVNEFDMVYLYVIVPDETDGTVGYLVDCIRIENEDVPGELVVYDVDPPEENDYSISPILWDTWKQRSETGRFQIWDNEYGHNYCYYTPILIGDEEIGLICGEISIDNVNKASLMNALATTGLISFVYVLCVLVVFYIIRRIYVKRIQQLDNDVREFSMTKDYGIADRIRGYGSAGSELDSLSYQISDLILDIKRYVADYAEAQSLYVDSKVREAVVNQLALKDSLTGAYNKTAYDSMCENVDSLINSGNTEFGIAMIDLNYLKKINDTYGHSRGNSAIMGLYDLICEIYPSDNVFRIGGDEFVVVLEGESYKKAGQYEDSFNNRVRQVRDNVHLKPWTRVSAAIGIALFRPGKDKSINDVFKRADQIMYENKKKMKAERK